MPAIDSGHTAWILTASAFVLLMTPGLALFYGGMTRSKSVLNMMMMSFGSIGVVSILWVCYGYSVAFGQDTGGVVGDLSLAGLRPLIGTGDGVPDLLFASFQLMFAIITVALISGAIADRVRYAAWLIFIVLWATLVYFPVAHWVWGEGGWLYELGVIDYAGGTAVHINAGAAALGLVLVLGKRLGWPKERMRPHNLPMVLLGAALLWFGWFGFNAGSGLTADASTAVVFLNTQVATAAAVMGWLAMEWIRDGKPTTLGAASGAIAGLVAVTPSCAVLEPMGAIGLGVVAGVVCALAVGLKYQLKYDDSLDVVGVHMVGGAIGSLLIGLLATTVVTGGDGAEGLLYGGPVSLLGKQAVGVVAVMVYSFVMAALLGLLIDKTVGFRVKPEAEVEGVDIHEHAESGYDFSGTGVGGPPPAAVVSASAADSGPSAAEAAASQRVSG